MITWRKSSRSDASGNACVEVARVGNDVGIRDSKHPEGGHFTLEPRRAAMLARRIKTGATDL